MMATMVNIESRTFEWNISGFSDLICDKDKSEMLTMTFDAGATLPFFPSTWKYTMKREDEVDGRSYVSVYLKCVKGENIIVEVLGTNKCKLLVKSWFQINETQVVGKLDPLDPMVVEGRWGCKKFRELGQIQGMLGINGNLSLKFYFTLSFSQNMSQTEQINYWIMGQHVSTIKKGLGSILESLEFADFVLIGSDNVELKVHKFILATYSPVFRVMFQHEGMVENVNNQVKIEDITSKGLENMLHFMYNGKLKPTWIDVCEEVVYGAQKYQIDILKEYVDNNLAEFCNTENATAFYNLSVRFELKNAEAKITKFVGQNPIEVFKAAAAALIDG